MVYLLGIEKYAHISNYIDNIFGVNTSDSQFYQAMDAEVNVIASHITNLIKSMQTKGKSSAPPLTFFVFNKFSRCRLFRSIE